MSTNVYVVAVLMEQKGQWTESAKVQVGLFPAASPVEAKDLAAKEFAEEGWSVKAWTGGLLSNLERYYLGTGDIPAVEA